MGTISPPAAAPRHVSGQLYLWLGIGLVLLGPVLYVIQLRARLLTVPWYLPMFATAGVVLVFLAGLRDWSIWRIAAVAICGLLAGAEWYLLLSLSKVPPYTGPVATGVSFPAFTTTRADGSAFNQDSLRGEQDTALVFFRGRW